MPIIRLKPIFKKFRPRQSDELCPNYLKCSIPHQKINIDNIDRFHYQEGHWFGLMDASICEAKADADTQFTISDLSALEK